ncbi:hypothetical protein Ccrd_007275 [Cynara cardunculus var. scolymus]|uniref:Glycosyltransferase 2-like domain-containing protein n=1 Tax=Cynara cardunculus var. scolymus TaxID=59895 RepID=A0A103XHA8_CYNCS|nr:hypothetical protein Ccrd_007275 [Cynara cardunculus var. scolymus]
MADVVPGESLMPGYLPGMPVDLATEFGMIWDLIKAPLIVPLLQLAVYICLAMTVMLFVERLYMGVVIILVKLFWKKPEQRYKWEPIREDVENGSQAYPMVLIQIPMFNEREVYKISIGAACSLSWPADRLVIQDMIEKECKRWASKGVNIWYQIRGSRGGYKAGALKEGLTHDYVKDCKYVAIFDADFRPEPDFLQRAIPFLEFNPQLALVQSRWRFGTGGVWRIAAINEAGGWKDRTTVEDMDLAVRASLKGWKFLYLGDLQVKSELPSTFKAFRFQQHRWSCGPANLFRKMVPEIIKTKQVTLWKKVYVIYSFFFVRKIIAHMVTFFFFCVVLPTSILVPERSNEWVVTEKLGDTLKNKKSTPKAAPSLRKTKTYNYRDRIHVTELGFAAFLFFIGCYDFMYGNHQYFVYIFLQTITFLIVGFGYVGITVVPR